MPPSIIERLSRYKGKWMSVYRNKLDDTYNKVMLLCIRKNQHVVRNPAFTQWACASVVHLKYACSLYFMLPENWKQSIIKSLQVSNNARCHVFSQAQPKAKAKAKPKVKPISSVIIGRIPSSNTIVHASI